MNNYLHSDLTGLILGAYFKVYNTLGYGFLEKVYERAMIIELEKLGLSAQRQCPIKVYYDSEIIGDYYADIIVDKKVIIELKTATKLIDVHEAQLVNYLRATKMEVGLLLNFGKEPEHKRRVLTNDYK